MVNVLSVSSSPSGRRVWIQRRMGNKVVALESLASMGRGSYLISGDLSARLHPFVHDSWSVSLYLILFNENDILFFVNMVNNSFGSPAPRGYRSKEYVVHPVHPDNRSTGLWHLYLEDRDHVFSGLSRTSRSDPHIGLSSNECWVLLKMVWLQRTQPY